MKPPEPPAIHESSDPQSRSAPLNGNERRSRRTPRRAEDTRTSPGWLRDAPGNSSSGRAASYLAAIAAVAVAFAVREALEGVFDEGLVYITFYPAIILAATIGGWGPGVVATLISAILAALWVIPNPHHPGGLTAQDAIDIAVFASLGICMSLLVGLYRSARRRTADYEKVQVAARESDEQFRTLFTNSVVGVVQFDLSGGVIKANDRFCLMTGYTRDIVRKKTAYDLFCIECGQPGRDEFTRFLNREIPTCEIETCFVRPEGGSIWVHLALDFVHDAEGRPERIAGIVEDISAAHRAKVERETTIEFLHLVNQASGTENLVGAAENFLSRQIGCDAVEVRITDGDAPAEEEMNRPGAGAVPDEHGVGPDPDRNGHGYGSVAMVPLEIGSTRLGFVQISDRRSGRFTAESIALWERLAGYLAVAIAKTRAEKELRDSEQRYRILVENSPDAIFVHRDGTFLYANPAALRLYGADGGSGLVGTSLLDRVHPDDRAWIRGRIEQATRAGSTPLSESRAVRLDGGLVFIEATASAILYGGAPAIQVIARDVSERRLVESVSGAVNVINQVIHSTHDVEEVMQLAVSEAARVTKSDTAAISMRRGERWIVTHVHGLPPESIGVEMNDEDERHAVLAIETKRPVAINDAFNDDRVNREHMRKWGVRSVLVVPLVVRDEAIGVIFLNHLKAPFEYTEMHLDFAVKFGSAMSLAIENARLFEDLRGEIRDRTARERRISVIARLYAVLSRVNEAIVRMTDEQSLYDEVCRIVSGEGAFPLVWIGELRGREVVPIASCGTARDYLAETRIEIDGPFGSGPTGTCVRENRSVVNKDFGLNRSTAPWRDRALEHGFRASAAFPLQRDGRVIGALTLYAPNPGAFDAEHVNLLEALCADISYALVAMDHERLRAEAERALRESERELRDVDRHKNEFMAALSHELRNPLAPIRNSLYILQRVDPSGEQARRAQAVIDRQVDQLAHLVDDLLDVTRIQRNKVQLQRRRVELNELVQRTIDDYRSIFEQTGVRLEFLPAPEPLFVSADWNRLAQVVGNLLQNAAKFTVAPGRVTVSVGSGPGRAVSEVANAPGRADDAGHGDPGDSPSRETGDQAVIRVTDTGIGMAPEMIRRLFQPFMQADDGLDRSKGGLGLGLALVKGLVELHGGEVRAESAGLGKGSEFIVSLPLDREESVALDVRATQAGGRRRILIIEDNVDAADSLREALEFAGHDVVVAYNGPDGIAKAREFRSEVVLCDIGLPGMSGYEVARVLKGDGQLKGAYLVALSGYAQPEDLQRAAMAGFERHLAKPPNLERLEQILAEAADNAVAN